MNAAPQFAVRYNGYHPSLGDASSPFSTTSGTASFTTSTAGSLTAAILPLVGLGPIGGIVAAGTALAAFIISQFKGCGQTCVLTSEAANQVEQQLQQILAAYFASGRTQSEQAAALAAFDNAWATLEKYCGSGSFGSAGTNCVQDRQSGSCKWETSPGSWSGCTWNPPGAAGSGSTCWNWFVGYRDPIANDPCVVPDTPAVTAAAQALGISSSTNFTPLLIVAGLLALAVLL